MIAERSRSQIAKRFAVKAVVIFPFGFGLLCCLWPFSESYSTWHQWGAIQIIGGTDELWCFIDIDRMVHLPGTFVSHPRRSIGRSQVVAVVSASGSVRRIDVAIPDGVPFHPNLSHVFRLGDTFYLYQGFSMDTHRSVFKWNQDHFDLLPLEESEALLHEHGLHKFNPANDAINEILLAEGWPMVFKDRANFNRSSAFEWNGESFQLGFALRDNIETVFIRRAHEPEWTADLVSYDGRPRELSSSEYEQLSNRPEQRGHSRQSP